MYLDLMNCVIKELPL